MSYASTIGQVVFSQKTGVYMPAIQSNRGDVFQEYDGDAANPTKISPDFTTNTALQPTLSFILTSSRASQVVTPNTMKWYFNETELTFSGNLSTNTFGGETGHFTFLEPASNSGYYGLKIVKNLVKASAGTSCTIRGEATVGVGNTSDKIQFVYTINITKGVGSQQRVTIMADDDKYFTIKEKGETCLLRAAVFDGGSEINVQNDTAFTYKWYKQVNGAWSELTGETSYRLEVSDTMIDTTGIFKLEVFKNQTAYGSDVQTVMDASDPWDILRRYTKYVGGVVADEQSESISETNETIVYEPWLVKRGTTANADPSMKFYIAFMDSVGNILNEDVLAAQATDKATCTYGMCEQAGGNVTYTITTAK